MIVSLSAVVPLGALVYLLWRHAGLKVWHATVCALFGFYLASTQIAPYVRDASTGIADWLSQL